MHSVCVVSELHVTGNCIKILTVAQQSFYDNLCHWQQRRLYIKVFVKYHTPTTLHMALFRRKI